MKENSADKNTLPDRKNKSQERLPADYSSVLKDCPTSNNPLDSFAVLPNHTKSSVLLDDERIILILRQHWITAVPAIFLAIVMAIIPLFMRQFSLFNLIVDGQQLFFLAFWYLCVGGILLQAGVIWFFNVYIITDERIIDVNFSSILASDISTAKIESIQDHSLKSAGILETVFNYGNITIQTAAEKNEFSFDAIPEPEKVNKLLGELIMEEEREKLEGRAS